MCLKRLTNSFRCHLCTESFRRQEWLQNHLQKIHKMDILSTNISQIQSGNPSAFNGIQNDTEIVKVFKCAICEETFSSKKIIDQHFWEAHQIGQTNIKNVLHERQPLNQVHDRKMPETSPTLNPNVETIGHQIVQTNTENVLHEHQPLHQVHDRKMPETSPTLNQSVETMETFTNSNNDTNISHIQNGNPSTIKELQTKMYSL